MSEDSGIVQQFEEKYRSQDDDAYRALKREICGGNAWVNGYTTLAQTAVLAERLDLGPNTRLLDVGSGEGWPSLHLAIETGCRPVLTDVPGAALTSSVRRAAEEGVLDKCAFARASGSRLPFRSASFDAVVHTDALC
jgi:ubiquinone/menaquinone biosynthesis C-methylase UbiE